MSLLLSVTDLRGEIGAFLGYGRGSDLGAAAWTDDQEANIEAALKSGLSQVYTPPPLGPTESSHGWTFLRPFADLVIEQGDLTVKLPESFGGFESDLYVVTPDSAARWASVRLTHEGHVQGLHAARPDQTGPPQVGCEQVIDGTTGNESTRSRLYVWPKTDRAYTVRCQYKHMPDALTGNYPYPPGGAEHAELFKASCLAAAELQFDDAQGPRRAVFMQLLAASVAADRKRNVPSVIGYNGDRSDARRYGNFGRNTAHGETRFWGPWPAVTYNGTPFD